MRTRMMSWVLGLALLGAAGSVHAQGWGGPRHTAFWRAGLDLTADQQKQLDQLRDSVEQKVAPLREEMFARSSELRQLWAAPAPDRNGIQAKQAQLDDVRARMRDAHTEYRLAALNVLTPAQREKVNAAGSGFGPGSGPGRGGGGPGRGMGPGWRW